MRTITRIATLWFVLSTSVARPAPPTEREAKALLATPSGSTSLGRTNGGELIHPVALPTKGKGYALLSMVAPRKTNFGTDELIAVITRATAKVADRYPGSVLGIGNLGFADGKKIPWSVSHQAGRDGDLGMYATIDGKPWERVKRGPMPFFAFDAQLATRGGAMFDLPRNLVLVQALIEDPEARVQYIFVAAWLKRALLEEGRRQGVAAQTLARLGEVMHQPTDSNPHADHYHLRLFCTIEDRLHGCVDRAPPRSWIDPGDRQHAEAARNVASVLELSGKKHEPLVLRALDRLAAMRASGELDAIAAALADPRKKVRVRALETLEVIADPRAAAGIVAALPRVEDPAWAHRLFAAIPSLDASSDGALLALARRALADPTSLLHPKAKKAEAGVLVASLAVLRDHGQSTDGAVDLALGRLGHRDASVRKAADAALDHLLCQPFSGTALDRYWQQHKRATPVEHAEAGLRARKLLTAKTQSREAVRQLIGLLDRRQSEVRVCAQRLLTSLTGHETDARQRGPARNKRHWAHWWRDHEAESTLR